MISKAADMLRCFFVHDGQKKACENGFIRKRLSCPPGTFLSEAGDFRENALSR